MTAHETLDIKDPVVAKLLADMENAACLYKNSLTSLHYENTYSSLGVGWRIDLDITSDRVREGITEMDKAMAAFKAWEERNEKQYCAQV